MVGLEDVCLSYYWVSVTFQGRFLLNFRGGGGGMSFFHCELGLNRMTRDQPIPYVPPSEKRA